MSRRGGQEGWEKGRRRRRGRKVGGEGNESRKGE